MLIVLHAHTCFAPGAFIISTSTVSVNHVQDKNLSKALSLQLAHAKLELSVPKAQWGGYTYC